MTDKDVAEKIATADLPAIEPKKRRNVLIAVMVAIAIVLSLAVVSFSGLAMLGFMVQKNNARPVSARQEAKGWYLKGRAAQKKSEHKKAIEAFEKAIEIDPDYKSAWNNKGAILETLGQFDEARDAYDKKR